MAKKWIQGAKIKRGAFTKKAKRAGMSVAAYAKRCDLPAEIELDLGNGVKWSGRLIPAGTFVMGSPPGEAKTEKETEMEKQHNG